MPELPEAETIVRDLRDRIVGHAVTGIAVIRPDILAPGLTPDRLDASLAGHRILAVDRRAKNIVLRFDGGRILLVNLGMTGRLVLDDSPRAAELRHIAVRFGLDDGRTLLYDDIRRFGRMELHSRESWAERDATLGTEPLSEDFTAERLFEMTRGTRVPLRNWLLDQRKVAGVGNIYANEALFRAGLHPARPAGSIDLEDAARLRDAIRNVLEEAIEARGTTFSDYRDASGEAGAFEPRLRVYGREGRPCPVCGTPIERIVISNRSAYFCPRCQR
jgi:formamidopyrimidine-DNA glycosylase